MENGSSSSVLTQPNIDVWWSRREGGEREEEIYQEKDPRFITWLLTRNTRRGESWGGGVRGEGGESCTTQCNERWCWCLLACLDTFTDRTKSGREEGRKEMPVH